MDYLLPSDFQFLMFQLTQLTTQKISKISQKKHLFTLNMQASFFLMNMSFHGIIRTVPMSPIGLTALINRINRTIPITPVASNKKLFFIDQS